MCSPILLAALLLGLHSFGDAKIDFTHSTIYDIYDIVGVQEIPVPRCNFGCLIFATAFGIHETNMGPYVRKLYIKDLANGQMYAISELLHKFHPDTSQKLPLDLAVKGNYSIVNLNDPEDDGDDVIVWAIERAKAQEIDYEVYDAAKMNRAPGVPNAVITIISGSKFRVHAEKEWEPNSYTARLVGFDNAFDDNEDLCESVLSTPVDSQFDGFKFEVFAPLISLVFAKKTELALKADFAYGAFHSLSSPGFLTSPGYIGCARLDEDLVYRNSFYHYSHFIELNGQSKKPSVRLQRKLEVKNRYLLHFTHSLVNSTDERVFYQVDVDCVADLDHGNAIEIKDETAGITIPILGGGALQHYQITLPNTQKVLIHYSNVTVPQSFILRYTTTPNRLTTPGQSTSAATSYIPLITTTQSLGDMTSQVSTATTAQMATTSATGAASRIGALAIAWFMLRSI